MQAWDELFPFFRCPHFAPAVESQLIKDIVGIVNDLGAECAALNSCRQHLQPFTQVDGDRRHLGDRKIALTVNQNRWPHEGNRLLFHPTIHNIFNRIGIVFIPEVPTMGQNSADELTSKRNWPVIKGEVFHAFLHWSCKQRTALVVTSSPTISSLKQNTLRGSHLTSTRTLCSVS